MKDFHIQLPADCQHLDDVLYKTLATKSVLQVDLIDPSSYQVSIQNQASCPPSGVKVIGQSAVKSRKSAIRCKSGNIFLPLLMRIETILFHHQCILSMKTDDDQRKWISRILFRALTTNCKMEVWDKGNNEISFLNYKAAVSFSRLYAWNLYPFTDEEIWKGASWFQLIEISTQIPISLYSRPAIKKHQREANRMMMQLAVAKNQKARRTISDRSTQISQLILNIS